MARLIRRPSGYYVKFRHGDRDFTRGVGKDETLAQLALSRVEDNLRRIRLGLDHIPEDASDPATWILTGQKNKPDAPTVSTLGHLADEFLKSRKCDPETIKTISIHLDHLRGILGTSTRLKDISVSRVQTYADTRAKKVRSVTIRKELATLRQALDFARKQGWVSKLEWSPRDIELSPDEGRAPFRTIAQIESVIATHKLTEEEQADLWETVYLASGEVADLLGFVQANAEPWITAMIAMVALTGCRRGEMLRSKREHWDFDAATVRIVERKRDKSKTFTVRTVPLHPRLSDIMLDWLQCHHPGGPWTISLKENKQLSKQTAQKALNRVLGQHPQYRHIPGFHTFRHSFASILASKDKDQRIIDEYLGHQTEAMRKRYRHLFPDKSKRAIEDLL